MKKVISSVLASATSLFPFSVLAVAGETTTAPTAQNVGSLADFYGLIRDAAAWLVVFGIIIGAVFIIVGGIQYMTSGGDEEGTKAAKAKIIGGIIGIAIVLLAFAVVNVVGSFFGAPDIVT